MKKIRMNISISEEAALILEEKENKSLYIEELLLQGPREPFAQPQAGLTKEEVLELINKAISPTSFPAAAVSTDFVPRPPDPVTGYPCCEKNAPCKHWVWDDMNTIWKNTLTGMTKDE